MNTINIGVQQLRQPVAIRQNGDFVNKPASARAPEAENKLPEILIISSCPPRECGIATYTQDLVAALNIKFSFSFKIQICPLESSSERHSYPDEIDYTLNTDEPGAFMRLSNSINKNERIRMVVVQHEFGFFAGKEVEFNRFLDLIAKPVIMVFHTVLPNPDEFLKENVRKIARRSKAFIVMTNSSSDILKRDYGIAGEKITVIPHGTHLVPHSDKLKLKEKYGLTGKKILSTFGLLSSGKNIETTLEALPGIVEKNPDVLFLIIGKTHPSVVKNEGEAYREKLEKMIEERQLQHHVRFVNSFLPLPDLLEYLQLTDIYLFTSKDRHQAVSGTFSYAISCGCPIISTPIPHAIEVLKKDAGIIVDFENSARLGSAVNELLADEVLRKNISSNGLHRMASTAWENSAIAHALLFESMSDVPMVLRYNNPEAKLDHVKKMTTDFGIIQFSKINQPDIDSGYTLDDNARAMVALCQHFELTGDKSDITYINIYLNFIGHCLQSDGYFLNYVNENKSFTVQNNSCNLADANGRAVWALGYLISLKAILPPELIQSANITLQAALKSVHKIHSTRAMAFVIKGLYYRNAKESSRQDLVMIKGFADRLVQMYKHEADKEWQWYESYLTYANSILPEAMLCAWLATKDKVYLEIAKSTFDFLLSKSFRGQQIKVISNKGWLNKGEETGTKANGGEQPIDVAYTILALTKFYNVFRDEDYLVKLKISFNWFLGNNHLHQVVYNPCTGGCYDGLEENYVNLNQGAESTVSYLMARLAIEKCFSDMPSNNKMAFTQNASILN